MKISELAKKYGEKTVDFEAFATLQKEVEKIGFFENAIRDEDVPKLIELYKREVARRLEIQQEKQRAEEEARKAEEEAQRRLEEEIERKATKKREALASMLITSGFSFDGYTIVKYSGYISGDDAVQIPRSGWLRANDNCQNLTGALSRIRIQALKELKEAAYDLGCNAVIGVDFDYITLEPETANASGGTTYEPYVICVTANGNAVIIEKD